MSATNLAALRDEAKHCQRCDLYRNATQTVFGEGLASADIFFVGEQPGDKEDLAGKPFVGPAGAVFNAALEEAQIDRARCYVTNAVKHFKSEPRGKRRLHKTPNAGEVQACKWWLNLELEQVRAPVVVALGATALKALTGTRDPLTKWRGRAHDFGLGRKLYVTVHPSYLLRIIDPAQMQRERNAFAADMREIAKLLAA